MMVISKRLTATLALAALAAGCSASVTRDDGPGWSLAEGETPRAAPEQRNFAGVTEGSLGTPSKPGMAHDGTGGRDAVTGTGGIAGGATEKTEVTVKPVKPVAVTKAPNTKLPVAKEHAAKDPVAKDPVAKDPASLSGSREAVVAKGDTLHGFSLKHHVSVKAIMTANNLTSTKIFPGQKLTIPEAPQ